MLGARGRMGVEVCKAVDAADDLDLVAMIDQGDWLFNASDAGAEVVVDFTTPDVVMDNLHWCVDQGINVRRRHQRLHRAAARPGARLAVAQARRRRGHRAQLRRSARC